VRLRLSGSAKKIFFVGPLNDDGTLAPPADASPDRSQRCIVEGADATLDLDGLYAGYVSAEGQGPLDYRLNLATATPAVDRLARIADPPAALPLDQREVTKWYPDFPAAMNARLNGMRSLISCDERAQTLVVFLKREATAELREGTPMLRLADVSDREDDLMFSSPTDRG